MNYPPNPSQPPLGQPFPPQPPPPGPNSPKPFFTTNVILLIVGGVGAIGFVAVVGLVVLVLALSGSSKTTNHSETGPSSSSSTANSGESPAPGSSSATTGADATASFFVGEWELTQWGGVQTVHEGDKTYREIPLYASQHKSLTINADGTYAWPQLDNSVIRGNWRSATKEEGSWSNEGPGIVLLKGKDGNDWGVVESTGPCTPKYKEAQPWWCKEIREAISMKNLDWGLTLDGTRTKS
jgi:hypothetical protein